MERARLRELHYIVAIENLASLVEHGILSHVRASALPHVDVSMAAIQERRHQKVVPDVRLAKPRKLHEYANLYFDARNPMMYVRKDLHAKLCVVRVSPDV